MITRLDRNKLNGERSALLDEVAEESRLANLPATHVEAMIDLVHKKHDECLEALEEYPDVDINDVIQAYRGCIRKVLKK